MFVAPNYRLNYVENLCYPQSIGTLVAQLLTVIGPRPEGCFFNSYLNFVGRMFVYEPACVLEQYKRCLHGFSWVFRLCYPRVCAKEALHR